MELGAREAHLLARARNAGGDVKGITTAARCKLSNKILFLIIENLPVRSSFSALLSGPTPPSDFAFLSDRLQISYFNTPEAWTDLRPHAHQESDECFLVLQGAIVIEVEGERVTVGPHEFCGFPRGTYHQVVEVHPPIECLVVRNSAGYDKTYLLPDGTSTTDRRFHQDLFSLLNRNDEGA